MGELLDIFYAGLVIYFIYKFITGLVMPVSKMSSDMRSTMKKMQEEQMNKRNDVHSERFSQPQTKPTAKKSGDYIDFEEVK